MVLGFAARDGWAAGCWGQAPGAPHPSGDLQSHGGDLAFRLHSPWGERCRRLLPGSCFWTQMGLPPMGALRLLRWRDLGSRALPAPTLV